MPRPVLRSLTLLLLLASLYNCKPKEEENKEQLQEVQNYTCESFKTGAFTLINTEKNLNTTIVRDARMQTETNNITGAVTKGLVTWVDACTYQMLYLESSSELAGNIIGKTLVVQIVNIKNNMYTYTAKLKGSNYTSTGNITKIE